MYTKEQEERVLAEFQRTGSATQAVRQLGYPTLSTLYRWFERRKAKLDNNHGRIRALTDEKPHQGCTAEHARHPSAEQKLVILHRCFEIGEDVEYVSRETGYSIFSRLSSVGNTDLDLVTFRSCRLKPSMAFVV